MLYCENSSATTRATVVFFVQLKCACLPSFEMYSDAESYWVHIHNAQGLLRALLQKCVSINDVQTYSSEELTINLIHC